MATQPTSGHLVVVGASTGGIPALLSLARALPAGFPAPLCVVQHIGANHSILPELLANSGPHPAVHGRDGQLLTPGVFHVAPPDQHILVEDGRIRLSRGPRENHTRPAVDPLFRSAALAWGARTIGVILSGALDDGTAGLQAIKDRGGTAVVQEPTSAEVPEMPGSALAFVDVDFSVTPEDMGPLLGRLVGQPAADDREVDASLQHEVAINRGEDLVANLEAIAQPAGLSCPDCGGGLWEVQDAPPLRYRCHTGHAFTARSLERAQSDAGELALRSSVRALQERELLLRRMASVADAVGDATQAEAARREAKRLHTRVRELRELTSSVRGEEP